MENHTNGYAFLQQEANPKPKQRHYATLNIGLFVNNGEFELSSGDVFKQLELVAQSPLQVLGVIRQQSNTEPTLIIRLDRPLTEDEAYKLSVKLRQECVAQLYKGEGHLYGPKAKDWGPFNPDYFLYYKG